MTLEVGEIQRDITLLKSYVVNDPTGRWRRVTRVEGEDGVRFLVRDEEEEVVHSFFIPWSLPFEEDSPVLRDFWVNQEKEQWIITEFIER